MNERQLCKDSCSTRRIAITRHSCENIKHFMSFLEHTQLTTALQHVRYSTNGVFKEYVMTNNKPRVTTVAMVRELNSQSHRLGREVSIMKCVLRDGTSVTQKTPSQYLKHSMKYSPVNLNCVWKNAHESLKAALRVSGTNFWVFVSFMLSPKQV